MKLVLGPGARDDLSLQQRETFRFKPQAEEEASPLPAETNSLATEFPLSEEETPLFF